MKVFVGIFTFCALFAVQYVSASDEILNILSTAKDLTLQELNALRPLFNELQKQYDYITMALETEGQDNIVSWQKEIWPESTKEDHIDLLEGMLVFPTDLPTIEYDTKLPTLEELIGNTNKRNANMDKEQIAELEDIQQILQETLEEAQTNINELARRALLIESKFLKLNKPKIVMYIYKALSMVFRYSARLRRAAYCVYSNIPQLNVSLHNIYAGVDCYNYTSKVILTIQKQTTHTVNTIRRNIFDLAKIYKKIVESHSIIGKIITTVMNLLKITRDIGGSYSVARKALNDLENKLPNVVEKSINCGTNFAKTFPQIVSTAFSVTTCITFNGSTLMDYDILLSETDGDFDFGDIN